MDDQQTTPVNDTRFALTLLICVLVAVGYIALSRLGSSGETTIEQRPDVVVQLPLVHPSDNDPQVVPIDPPDGGVPKLSNRPETRNK